MRFESSAPTRIVFGPGLIASLGIVATELGRRALLVLGSRTLAANGTADQLALLLADQGIAVERLAVSGEPDVAVVDAGAQLARERGCDVVVGVGGGSAIDAAKAVAGLATNPGSALDYLEVVGRGQALAAPALPLIAVPTTAGTGAEVTRNAVILAPAQRFKASIRSPFLYPRIALIDPELARSLPAEVTASTGLDALTQLVESYVSVRANPLADALALDGIRRAAGALRRAVADGGDVAARTEMALASLFSGIALANAGLGAVHGFASPLGGRYPIPHGVACATLLPQVMRVNVRALREREPAGPGLARYRDVARILVGSDAGSPDAEVDAGIVWIADLCHDLRIPALGAYGVRPEDVPDLVAAAAAASSTRGNPIALTASELADALVTAIG